MSLPSSSPSVPSSPTMLTHSESEAKHQRDRLDGDEAKMAQGDIYTNPYHDDADYETSAMMDGERQEIISAQNIHKTYLLGVEGVPALRGVNLSIARGEFIVILGKSGGGKTSMLNILGTIDKPTKGELSICGKRITSATTDQEFADLRLRKIGFVFQTFNLISSMTAEENVSLPMVLDGRRSRKQIKERAHELLTRVGLGARTDHLPSQLSGGEQQRVTIARAIANRPEILLLDEPTGDLDTKNGTIILNLLLQLNRKEKITCIMVTHDTSMVQYAHRVVHMLDGKVLRIEPVSPATRAAADQNVKNQLDMISRVSDSTYLSHQTATSEFRDPDTFYSFIAHQNKMMKEREFQQSEERKKKQIMAAQQKMYQSVYEMPLKEHHTPMPYSRA